METKPVILDDKKFALYGKRTDKGVPKMSFSVFNGNPAIGVFTNDPADTETKPIRAGMDALIWSGFVATLEKMIGEPNDSQIRIVNRKGPPQKTFTDSITVVGKDAEGVIYLALKQGQRPVKKFPILPGTYMDLTHKDGAPLNEGEKSQLYAKGFIKQLDAQVTKLISETYTPPQPFGGKQQGGYGGGQGGGGYNKQQEFKKPAAATSDFDDDMPM